MALRMFARAIARVEEHGGRRITPAELRRDNQGGSAYCLTEECYRWKRSCLTKNAPEASSCLSLAVIFGAPNASTYAFAARPPDLLGRAERSSPLAA